VTRSLARVVNFALRAPSSGSLSLSFFLGGGNSHLRIQLDQNALYIIYRGFLQAFFLFFLFFLAIMLEFAALSRARLPQAKYLTRVQKLGGEFATQTCLASNPRVLPQPTPPHSNSNTNTTSTSTSTSILLTYHLPAQPPSISSLSLFRTNTLFCYQRQPPQPSSLSFRLVFVTHHRANATPTLTRPRRVSPNTPTQINSNHPREPPNRLPTTTHSSQSATTNN
jgi:hypothetical protein